MKYSHAFSISFSIDSDDEKGEDITAEQFAAAIRKRVDELLEWSGQTQCLFGAVELYDTYAYED